jgi:hypothetical protein
VCWGAPALRTHSCRIRCRVDPTLNPEEGLRAMMELGLIAWLMCSLPASMLLGYCALGEE